MPTPIKLKFYKYNVGGQTNYDLLPSYNVPQGQTEVSDPNEINQAINYYKGVISRAGGQEATGLQKRLSDFQAGGVSSEFAYNEQGVLAEQKQIASQQAEQQKLASGLYSNWGTTNAPLLVPKGTPTPQQSNAAFQATQPKPIYSETLNKDATLFQPPNQNQIDYSSEIAQLQAMTNSLTNQQTGGSSDIDALFQKYMGDQTPPPKYGEEYATSLGTTSADMATNENNVRKQVNDLTVQLNAITTGAQVATQQLESQAGGRDITGTFLGRKQQEISRQAVIKGLPISAQLAVAQGNLDLASKQIDRLFTLQMQDEDNLYNYKQNLINKVYEFATTKEKNLLEQKKIVNEQAFILKRDKINNANDLANTAMANGQANIAGQIAQIDWNSPNADMQLSKLQSQIIPITKISTTNTTQTPVTQLAENSGILDRLNLVNQLLQNPKLGNIFGPIQQYTGGFFGQAATAKNQFNQLKGQLSLDNRKLLKGSGAISDFESRTLEQAASALGRNLSDAEGRKQLAVIKGALQTASGLPANVIVEDPKTKIRKSGQLDRMGINEAIASGYTIEYTE